MQEPTKNSKEKSKKPIIKNAEKSKIYSKKLPDSTHLGSSNAFEETENPLSRDEDHISDEKLDNLVGDE
jgi:hypothetical protein